MNTTNQDMMWTTVTLRPGLHCKANEYTQTLMSACGRILIAVQPDSAHVYRRGDDGDYELVTEIDLNRVTGVVGNQPKE